MAIIVPLGIAAGLLSTVAGIGGGLLITVVLAALLDPHTALAVTAPALLLGTGHRMWLFRRHLVPAAARRMVLGAVVGAAVGGLISAALPEPLIRWLLLGVTVVAVAREQGWVRIPLGRSWLTGGGAVVGFVTATTGGGGLILAPLMLAAGLRGKTLVATGAMVACSIHVARIMGYAGTGMLGPADLPTALVLGVGILAGNLLGRWVRPRLGEAACHAATWVALVGGLLVAAVGLGR
ncbi:MAG: sulfite exporter TauE/SafE family protein [Myxococcota bacterium]